MIRTTYSRGVSQNALIGIVALVVVVAIGAYTLGTKTGTDGSDQATTTATSQVDITKTSQTSTTKAPAPTKTTATPVVPNSLRTLLTAQPTKCEMKTTVNGVVSGLTVLAARGNLRMESQSGSMHSWILFTPSGSYTWNNATTKVISGSSANLAAQAILNLSLSGFTCKPNVVDDITFVAPQ